MNMSKSLSVLKSIRQNQKRKERNWEYKDTVRKYRKKIKKMIEKKEEVSDIMDTFKIYMSSVDKAGKKSIFHKNNIARKKSRMNKMIKIYAQNSLSSLK